MTNSREGVLGNHLTAPTYFRQRGAVPSENDAKMELHRLHAQLHDRLPRPLWGVDRVDVGLHVRISYIGSDLVKKDNSSICLSISRLEME